MDQIYKILIVDDEPLARFSFRNLIETRFPGFVVSGEAGTGPEGLEIFSRIRPDIVMMDIQIPDLNGLETSRLILERHPEAQIIVLSAYDQFEYVQDAINHGVLGYLLKPVQEKKLARLLDLAVQRIISQRETLRDLDQLKTYRQIAESDMVSSFIYGSCGGLSAGFYADHLKPSVKSGFFVLFRLDEIPTQMSRISTDISDFIKHLPGCSAGRWMGGILPVFIKRETGAEIDEVLVESIAHRLQILSSRTVLTGIGSIKSNPAEFPLSYRQAMNALETGQSPGQVFEYSRELEDRFFTALKSTSPDNPVEILDQFLRRLSEPDVILRDCQTALTEFLIQLRRFMEDQGDMQGSLLIANMLRDIPLQEDRLELLSWIAQSLMDYMELQQNSHAVEDLQIRKILKYIDLNDFNEVSLETTARSVGLTPQYVSKIFKDKYKMNFLEYLISRRMEFACRLLKESDMTVRKIAGEAGYGDVNYFSKVFKKQKGMSPREYRQSN
ncbi:response regulator [Oceanispirochaeta sp.]|uniref:response regulator n=1 Tax=Oceanispirochaeta sp. TaxID=2035350 RepID=UPI002629A789|nr:response regulator [Oceanispirochaeta sp.]MDA3955914.1 response regulator [Oceanispirochaeta sp.]